MDPARCARVPDSATVARYRVDPDRSTVTAVARPALEGRNGTTVAEVTGIVDVGDDGSTSGSITVTLAGDPPARAEIPLAGTGSELATGHDGDLVLHGRTSRPAGAFGRAGPPLLNPTLLLRWRLVLVLA